MNDPFAQSQSSSERLEQHTRSLPSPQSSLTPLSSSILADMRSSSKESKDQECAVARMAEIIMESLLIASNRCLGWNDFDNFKRRLFE